MFRLVTIAVAAAALASAASVAPTYGGITFSTPDSNILPVGVNASGPMACRRIPSYLTDAKELPILSGRHDFIQSASSVEGHAVALVSGEYPFPTFDSGNHLIGVWKPQATRVTRW